MGNESKKKADRARVTKLRYDVSFTIDVALERGVVGDPHDLEVVLEEAIAALVDGFASEGGVLADTKKPRLRLVLDDSVTYDVRFVERVDGDDDSAILHHAAMR